MPASLGFIDIFPTYGLSRAPGTCWASGIDEMPTLGHLNRPLAGVNPKQSTSSLAGFQSKDGNRIPLQWQLRGKTSIRFE